MEILDNIISDCLYVCENNKFVKINYEKIDEIINDFSFVGGRHWLESNPFNILDMDISDIINFLLIYHTVGDYCFWGNPKWEINTSDGVLDGSFGMIYILLNYYKKNKSLDLSRKDFFNLLKGNVLIPMFDDRYDNLVIMNKFLKDNNSDFYSLIKDFNTDYDLFNYILTSLDYFKDTSIYNNREVSFYKRCQLLVSDILHVREKLEGISVDYSHLVGCADYKIPQVMRCYGMIDFDSELSERIDNMVEIEKNSLEEISIRSSCLVVIDYIYKKLSGKVSKIDINDYLWLLGQDKSIVVLPYHRTLTNKY